MATTLFPELFAEPVNDLTAEDRNALVLSCEKLCSKLAHDAVRGTPGIDVGDLTQEALLVCTEAASRWSPKLGTKFSTYATPGIRRHVEKIVIAHRSRANVQVEEWDGYTAGQGAEDDDEGTESEPLTSHQAEAIQRLNEPMRTVVKLVVEDQLAPDRIAEQLDLELKDVKLMMRNAARQLRLDLASFAKPALFDFCGVSDDEAA